MNDMNKAIDVVKLAQERFPDAIMVDGMNEAIVGFSIRLPNQTNFVYSVNAIIKVLMMRDGMSYFEAEEFYLLEIDGQKFKESVTPIYLDDRMHYSNN
jgi:hypothetical protein